MINTLEERPNAFTGEGRALNGQQASTQEFADSLQKKTYKVKKNSEKLKENPAASVKLWGSGVGDEDLLLEILEIARWRTVRHSMMGNIRVQD